MIVYNDYAVPTPTNGGLVCRGFEQEVRVVLLTREALWRDHLFAPLEAWIKRSLAPAAGLAILRTAGGSRAAELMPLGIKGRGWDKLLPLAPSPPPFERRWQANRRRMIDALV